MLAPEGEDWRTIEIPADDEAAPEVAADTAAKEASSTDSAGAAR